MNPKEFKKDDENLSAEDSKLKFWLKELPRVEAPKDFDFRLKARLAETSANHQKPSFIWVLRYAVPVLAVAFIIGLIAFGGRFWGTDETLVQVPPIEENSVPANLSVVAVSPTPLPDNREKVEKNVEVPPIPKNETARNEPKDTKTPKTIPNDGDKNVFTRDFSVKPPEVKQPANDKRTIRKPQNFENPNPIPLQSVLSNIGVEAVLDNGKWTVKSVTPNSLAERSGIQNADVLESIDEKVLEPETVFKKSAEGKTVTVSRGGIKKVIVLQNK